MLYLSFLLSLSFSLSLSHIIMFPIFSWSTYSVLAAILESTLDLTTFATLETWEKNFHETSDIWYHMPSNYLLLQIVKPIFYWTKLRGALSYTRTHKYLTHFFQIYSHPIFISFSLHGSPNCLVANLPIIVLDSNVLNLTDTLSLYNIILTTPKDLLDEINTAWPLYLVFFDLIRRESSVFFNVLLAKDIGQ